MIEGLTQYSAEKSLQILLNAKFDLQEKLRVYMCNDEELRPIYENLFNAIDKAIKQTTKKINDETDECELAN